MEHIAAFLLIIGCSDGLTQCRELPAPVPVFETVEDCHAELPRSFEGARGSYPQLFVECFEVDPMLAETDSEIVWDITADGRLTASVEPIDMSQVVVASGHGGSEGESVIRR